LGIIHANWTNLVKTEQTVCKGVKNDAADCCEVRGCVAMNTAQALRATMTLTFSGFIAT